jgi:putative glutamine amidotransferase
MAPPPLIAVCARVLTFSDEGKRDAFSSSQPYSRAVARAGGVPVLVPPIRELYQNAHTVLQHFDGVLLPGGGDVDPNRYGAEPDDDTLYGVVPAHDDLDIAICLAAIDLDLPMLALCRGMQVLNVALGGSLVQDIGNSDHWMREHPVHRGQADIQSFAHQRAIDIFGAHVTRLATLEQIENAYPRSGGFQAGVVDSGGLVVGRHGESRG